MEKNESFLLQKDFTSNEKYNNVYFKQRENYAKSIINNLKKYWSEIDNESKENFRYLSYSNN